MSRPLISEAESSVMEAIWAEGPLGAKDLLARLGAARGWGEATVRTLIHRLIKKHALRSERRGAEAAYVALVRREDYVTAQSQDLLDRLFDGKLTALVEHLSREQRLEPADVARLRRLVAQLDADEEAEG
jgi:predicted transcriptional regulator